MIYEIRTYRIAPAAWRGREAFRRRRTSTARSTPSCSRSGHHGDRPLNEIVHVWRTRISPSASASAAGAKAPKWNPRQSRSSSARCAPRSSCRSSSCPRSGAASSARSSSCVPTQLKPRHAAEVAKAWKRCPSGRALAAGARGRRRVPDAPTASCTSGRTRAWISARRCAPKRPSGASGRRRAAATRLITQENKGSPARRVLPAAVASRADGTARRTRVRRALPTLVLRGAAASSVVIVASSCARSSGRVT